MTAVDMKSRAKAKVFEELYADDTHEYVNVNDRHWPRDRYEVILRETPDAERLLDIGCGNGQLLYTLRDKA